MHPPTFPSTSPSPIGTISIRTPRRRHGPFSTIAVVTLMTLMGLAALSGVGGTTPQRAAAHATGGLFLGHYGTAVVDGVIAEAEYGQVDAPTADETKKGLGCWTPAAQTVDRTTYHFKICETNDEQNDYYAFAIDDLSPSPAKSDPFATDSLFILFDDEHDGDVDCPGWQDMIGVQATGAFWDWAYCGQWDDLVADEPQDGAAAVTFTPGVGYVFELAHPLNSGDPADYALALHDTVGFCAVYLDAANAAGEVEYPFVNSCFGEGQNYAHVYKKGKYDDVLAKLFALVDSCEPCPPDVRRPLREDLDLAIRQYMQNDEAAAAQTLQAFVTQVERSMQAGTLPEAVGRQLTDEATPLLETLSASAGQTKAVVQHKIHHDSARSGKARKGTGAANHGRSPAHKAHQHTHHAHAGTHGQGHKPTH